MKETLTYLGSFGKYQAYLYFLCFLPGLLGGAAAIVFSWVGFTPNFRCRLPGEPLNASFSAPFETNNQSYFYAPNVQKMFCDYCPTATFNESCTVETQIPCRDGKIYDTTMFSDTLTIKFDMTCGRSNLKANIWTAGTFGVALGAAAAGQVADRFGRRPVFLLSALITSLSLNGAALATNYYAYTICMVIAGFGNYGCYLTAFIVFMELVGEKPRTIMGIMYQAFYTMGLLYVGLVAYFLRDWRLIQLAAGLPTLLYIPYYWVFPESIRWLAAKGKKAEAKALLLHAARFNGVVIPDAVLDKDLDVDEDDARAKGTVIDLFRHCSLAKNTLIVFFTWCATSMAYYGLLQNTQDLPWNVFLSYTLSAVSEIPGFMFSIVVMEYWGRRPALIVTFIGGGVFCILAGFLQSPVLVVSAAMFGKMLIAASFGVIYNYSAEIFPTVVRQAATGCSSIAARIGSMSAPQIHLLASVHSWLPIVIYGSFACAAGLLDVFLPETRNREIPETIDDGVHFSDLSRIHQASIEMEVPNGEFQLKKRSQS